VISVAVTFESVLGGAELVASVAVVAGGHVGQVLGLDMTLDGAVVLGAVAAHRALQGAIRQPAPSGTFHPQILFMQLRLLPVHPSNISAVKMTKVIELEFQLVPHKPRIFIHLCPSYIRKKVGTAYSYSSADPDPYFCRNDKNV
jgi:hypothetical protein